MSITCIPVKADTPINKKTPYKTAIGMYDSTEVKNTLRPVRMDMISVLALCSLTPKQVFF